MGSPGITSAGDVTFGNNSGQIAVGSNINQSQFPSINQTDLKELRESLLEFQKGIGKLEIDPNYQNVVNGKISEALIEAKNEEPGLSEIRQCFEKSIQMLKKAGKTIESISELYEPAKKIAAILRIGALF